MNTNKDFYIGTLKNRLGNVSELMEQNAELAFSLYHTTELNYEVSEIIELFGYEYDDEIWYGDDSDLYEEISTILYEYGYGNIVKEHVDEDYTDDDKKWIIERIDSCIKELSEYFSSNEKRLKRNMK